LRQPLQELAAADSFAKHSSELAPARAAMMRRDIGEKGEKQNGVRGGQDEHKCFQRIYYVGWGCLRAQMLSNQPAQQIRKQRRDQHATPRVSTPHPSL